ncbi:CBD9-like protein, partial [Violaceomyces palustris]
AAETGMTSDTYCNTKLCLQAIYIPSKSQINYTLTTDGGGQGIGWYGVGTGRRMSGSNMMVGWVNPDSSVTLSQRTASGHNTPTTSISSSAMTIDTQLSKSNSSMTVWSWSFPVTSAPSSSEYHIWAYNNQRTPSSSSASSSISEHNAYGTLTLDLTKAYNPTTDSGSSVTTPGSSPSSSSSSNSEGGQSASGDGARVLNSSNKLIIAHMVFMILAWLIVSPLAVLIGRWGRTFFKWFPIHRNLQIVTVLLFAIGFVLILIEVGKEAGAEHFDSNHAKAGLAILILVAIQLVLGQLGHKTKRWNPVRIVHVILGLVTTFLAIWNCAEGLEIWDWQPAKWSRYLVFIWGGLILIAYLAGLTMLPRDLR